VLAHGLLNIQQKQFAALGSGMDTFAPEFSKFWRAEPAGSQGESGRASADDEASKQEAALEELADRVSAARSIV